MTDDKRVNFKKMLKKADELEEVYEGKKVGRIWQKEQRPKIVDDFLRQKEKIIKGEKCGFSKTPLKMEKDKVIKAPVILAQERAEKIIEQANKEVEMIKSQAEKEKELAITQGYEKGYQEGLAQVTELLLKAKEERKRWFTSAEPKLVELSIKIAKKIIGQELNLDQWKITTIVKEALQAVKEQERIIIRVNADDIEKLKVRKNDLLNTLEKARDIEFKTDSEIALDGCVIETEIGRIDAQIDTQLSVIEKTLLSLGR
ncbi:MAG: FliH/SctL family protein [bacterium]